MEGIEQVNDRLKAANVPVRVRLKGKNLALRATLPKKPGDGIGRKQYDISLLLSATKDGLKRAEREAHKLAQNLAEGSFTWKLYIGSQHDPQAKPIAQWVNEFKDEYFRTHRIKEATWSNTWAGTFRKLPANEPISETLLLAVVFSTEEDSRNRELTCQRLQRFAEFVGLQTDLSFYKGEYEPEPRDIPTDEMIIEWRDRIPNQRWQWVYGMLATFGLRPHEAFACEFIDPLTLKVHQGTKTGSRITRAILPEWAKQWHLIEMKRPNVRSSGRACGQLVSRQFGIDRDNLPFVPYDLRHAWAVRASVAKGLPVSTAAAMMGHSVTTHTRIYHRWLSDAQNERVYRSLILGEG
ncbi:site-specific integrase [Phormidium sp. FACHB-592]|uniref:Tyr recombinase domain-containing protein n=1 Tax=Stenomitos frigidus AS-A4 TaxID=2933935 RepID=A0ABV0KK66_9CYAN|nr:site-specific integrase [Phormidium sp. FACHB-592]MBD2072699.1 site-specific integrase [Phormidium sp. FACHB-592]